MDKKPHSVAGFTLIEILIYIGLFTLIIGGLLFVIYGMIQGSSRLQGKVVIEEEAAFLLRKLDWALTGASDVSVPSADRLEITKPAEGLVFTLEDGSLMLARNGGGAVRLNTESVNIPTLTFTEIPAEDSRPAAVTAEFTITYFSESKTFETTKYLRK